jgi:hypothetical protein
MWLYGIVSFVQGFRQALKKDQPPVSRSRQGKMGKGVASNDTAVRAIDLPGFVLGLRMAVIGSLLIVVSDVATLDTLLQTGSSDDYEFAIFVAILGTVVALDKDANVRAQVLDAAAELNAGFTEDYEDFRAFLTKNLDDVVKATGYWVLWYAAKKPSKLHPDVEQLVPIFAAYIEGWVKECLRHEST